MYLSQNQRVQLWKPHSSFFPSSIIINIFPIPFTRTFEFISPTSVLKPAITPTFEQFYPPPILTKHPVWYLLDTDFFITLRGTLYGLHWQHFQNSVLFQEIVAHGEKHLIKLLPQHPIPFDILKSNLFDHFLILLYHGLFKLNHLNRDDWINLKQLCIDWYFPGQTAIIIQKFCDLWHQQLLPLQRLLVLSIPSQQIIWQLNWEEEWQQKVHLVQIEESEEESCVEDDSAWTGSNVTFFLFTILSPFYHYIITLLQGHMVMHVHILWLTLFLIADSFYLLSLIH